MSNFISSLPQTLEKFSTDTQREVIKLHAEIIQNADDVMYLKQYIRYRKKWRYPRVSFDTFIDNPAYLGIGNLVYPEVRKMCNAILKGNYREAIAVCGIGGGKTLSSNLLTCYKTHELLCMRNPHWSFHLIKDKPITLMNMGTTATQALEVGFAGIRSFIQKSPFFSRFNPSILAGSIKFLDSNILLLAGNSKATTPLGFNIFCATLDEAAFYLDNENKQLAEEIYTALQRRIISRFPRNGLLIMISSPLYEGDFVMRKLEEAKNFPGVIFSTQMPTWKMKPLNKDYKTDIFYFNNRQSIILDSEPSDINSIIDRAEDTFDANKPVWEIPNDYKTAFIQDPDKAKRDFAAVPSKAIQAFMPHREIIERMFTEQENPLQKDGSYKFSEMPLRANYYIHLDLALNKKGQGDFAGLSMVHFGGWGENAITKERYKTVEVDLVERIGAGHTGEISFSDVRNKIYALKAMGFNIKVVTLDAFNSADSMQLLRSKGVRSEYLSVDRTVEPYQTLKELIYSERIKCHKMPILLEELSRLEISKASKIDHPPSFCFTGDTRVALLDGTVPTFKELSERFKKDEEFEVYSMSDEGVCVGKAKNSRITQKDSELVEIILDNFQVIRCTPDHLFMTYEDEWVKAKNLTTDICLKPFRRSVYAKGGWVGYETVSCIKKGKIVTHKMVMEDIYGKEYLKDKVIHHIDGNKINNTLKNLILLSKEEHGFFHTKKRHKEDKFYVQKLREGHRKYRENGGNEKSRLNMLNLLDIGKIKRGKEICSIEGCLNLNSAKGLCGMHYQRMKRIKLKGGQKKNHRILRIKKLNYREDVWDITVEKYHNFALTSGIFVHNSKDCSDALCLAGDTKISLLNGTEIPIKDLVGKEFYVYSCLPNGTITFGKAFNVHKTGSKRVVKILLDNGKYFSCSEDHKIMLRNGSYVEASNLVTGDSLMPLYKEVSVANSKHGLNGYIKYLDNSKGEYLYTHQEVAKQVFGFAYKNNVKTRQVIHHIDINKQNNTPDNLKVIGWDEHRDLHNKLGNVNLKIQWGNPEFRENCKQRSSITGKITGRINITKYNKSKERVEKLRKDGVFSRNGKVVMGRLWKDSEFIKKHKERLSGKNNYQYRQDVTYSKILEAVDKGCHSENSIRKYLKCGWRSYRRALLEAGINFRDFNKNFYSRKGIYCPTFKKEITKERIEELMTLYSTKKEVCKILGINLGTLNKRLGIKNHKVVSLEILGIEEVYDLQVENYNNLALSSGIFVHNCGAVFNCLKDTGGEMGMATGNMEHINTAGMTTNMELKEKEKHYEHLQDMLNKGLLN